MSFWLFISISFQCPVSTLKTEAINHSSLLPWHSAYRKHSVNVYCVNESRKRITENTINYLTEKYEQALKVIPEEHILDTVLGTEQAPLARHEHVLSTAKSPWKNKAIEDRGERGVSEQGEFGQEGAFRQKEEQVFLWYWRQGASVDRCNAYYGGGR